MSGTPEFISRRTFVKGAALVGGVLSVGGVYWWLERQLPDFDIVNKVKLPSHSVASDGAYVYFGVGPNPNQPEVPTQLQILDTHEQKIAGVLDVPDDITDIQILGNSAYLNVQKYGLQVADISDPAQPRLTANRDQMEFASGRHHTLAIMPDTQRAYAILGKNLRQIDTTDPSQPISTKTYQLTVEGNSIFPSRTHLLIGTNNGMLVAFDASKDGEPKVAGGIQLGGELRAGTVDKANGLAYVISNWNGPSRIYIVDVLDPANMQLLAVQKELGTGFVNNITLKGHYLYVTTNNSHQPNGGLRVIDVLDPTKPTNIATYETRGSSDVAVVNGLVYLASSDPGLLVLSPSKYKA